MNLSGKSGKIGFNRTGIGVRTGEEFPEIYYGCKQQDLPRLRQKNETAVYRIAAL